jgi:predicted nucleic acid-binding protein
MMTADSNVFLYLWDTADVARRTIARDVLRGLKTVPSAIGLQVVGEVQNVLTRKLKQKPAEAAQHGRDLLMGFDTFAPARSNVEEALGLMARGRYQYWDALLLTTARDAGCTVMFSEDMADGSTFGPLEIVNPFGVDGLSGRARELLNA